MPDNMNESIVSSMLAKSTTPVESGNFLQEIENTARDAEKAAMAESASAQLSDISDDLGLITSGEFRVGNGNEPGDGFSGVRIAYPPMSYDGDDWNIVGIFNDVLEFGLNSDDGSAYFAGGHGTINLDGINLFGLRYALRHYATDINGLNPRYGRMEMYIPDGDNNPALKISSHDAAITELVLNGGFETGDLTNWTATVGAFMTITASTIKPKTGVYGSVFYYTYSNAGPSAYGDSGSLLSDEMSVTAGSQYTLRFNAASIGGYSATGYVNVFVQVLYYNSGHSLIGGSGTFGKIFTSTEDYSEFSATLIPMVGAVYAKVSIATQIYVAAWPSTGTMSIYVDDVSLSLSGKGSEIILHDYGARTDKGKIVAAIDRSWTPQTPVLTLVATGTGNCTNGVHIAKITFKDAFGNESMPSAASNSVTVDGTHKQYTITLPLGPAGTVSRKAYITKVGSATDFFFVGEMSDNATTSTTINVADASLGAQLTQLTDRFHSRPTMPTNASVMFFSFSAKNAAGADITRTLSATASAIFSFFLDTSAANANDGDVYATSIYIAAGTYTCTVYGITANACGKADWYLDGVVQTSGQDWYSASTTYNVVKTFTLTVLNDGWHRLHAVVNGKNATSTDFRLLIQLLLVQ
jgi:hypothetical protein